MIAKAGYIPLVQLLLMPLDCSKAPSGDAYVLDADPSLQCWDSVRHVADVVVGVFLVVVYTVVAARIVSTGGQLPNIEFHPTRFWRRDLDTFQPSYGHPLSPAHFRFALVSVGLKLALVVVTLFFTQQRWALAITPCVIGVAMVALAWSQPPHFSNHGPPLPANSAAVATSHLEQSSTPDADGLPVEPSLLAAPRRSANSVSSGYDSDEERLPTFLKSNRFTPRTSAAVQAPQVPDEDHRGSPSRSRACAACMRRHTARVWLGALHMGSANVTRLVLSMGLCWVYVCGLLVEIVGPGESTLVDRLPALFLVCLVALAIYHGVGNVAFRRQYKRLRTGYTTTTSRVAARSLTRAQADLLPQVAVVPLASSAPSSSLSSALPTSQQPPSLAPAPPPAAASSRRQVVPVATALGSAHVAAPSTQRLRLVRGAQRARFTTSSRMEVVQGKPDLEGAAVPDVVAVSHGMLADARAGVVSRWAPRQRRVFRMRCRVHSRQGHAFIGVVSAEFLGRVSTGDTGRCLAPSPPATPLRGDDETKAAEGGHSDNNVAVHYHPPVEQPGCCARTCGCVRRCACGPCCTPSATLLAQYQQDLFTHDSVKRQHGWFGNTPGGWAYNGAQGTCLHWGLAVASGLPRLPQHQNLRNRIRRGGSGGGGGSGAGGSGGGTASSTSGRAARATAPDMTHVDVCLEVVVGASGGVDALDLVLEGSHARVTLARHLPATQLFLAVSLRDVGDWVELLDACGVEVPATPFGLDPPLLQDPPRPQFRNRDSSPFEQRSGATSDLRTLQWWSSSLANLRLRPHQGNVAIGGDAADVVWHVQRCVHGEILFGAVRGARKGWGGDDRLERDWWHPSFVWMCAATGRVFVNGRWVKPAPNSAPCSIRSGSVVGLSIVPGGAPFSTNEACSVAQFYVDGRPSGPQVVLDGLPNTWSWAVWIGNVTEEVSHVVGATLSTVEHWNKGKATAAAAVAAAAGEAALVLALSPKFALPRTLPPAAVASGVSMLSTSSTRVAAQPLPMSVLAAKLLQLSQHAQSQRIVELRRMVLAHIGSAGLVQRGVDLMNGVLQLGLSSARAPWLVSLLEKVVARHNEHTGVVRAVMSLLQTFQPRSEPDLWRQLVRGTISDGSTRWRLVPSLAAATATLMRDESHVEAAIDLLVWCSGAEIAAAVPVAALASQFDIIAPSSLGGETGGGVVCWTTSLMETLHQRARKLVEADTKGFGLGLIQDNPELQYARLAEQLCAVLQWVDRLRLWTVVEAAEWGAFLESIAWVCNHTWSSVAWRQRLVQALLKKESSLGDGIQPHCVVVARQWLLLHASIHSESRCHMEG